MKRTICWIFSVLFLLFCGGGAALGGTTLIDGSGATLAIPENREEITIASVYAVSVPFITALELTDRVVAINVKSKFWTEASEGLAAAGSVGRGAVDLEALAEFAPGVLIHRSNDAATVEAVTEKLGIPVLCLAVENLDDIMATLTMMGEYFGREARAKEVRDWLAGKFAMIDEIVVEIPEEERVTALMMGGALGRVAGGDMLQSWMIEKAGGICVAAGTVNKRNWIDVGVETIFEWDPDFIFCTGSTPLDYTVEGLLNDAAWSAMTAVREKAIFNTPARIDSWDMPGISCAIGTMYMLHRMYPRYMPAERLQQEIDEYYMFMFGETFGGAYLGYRLEN